MSKKWTINSDSPSNVDKYEWHLPNNDQEHVEETVAAGDLMINPEDISLSPTLSPKKSGIQSGQVDWTYESQPDPSWYIFGTIIQDDD